MASPQKRHPYFEPYPFKYFTQIRKQYCVILSAGQNRLHNFFFLAHILAFLPLYYTLLL